MTHLRHLATILLLTLTLVAVPGAAGAGSGVYVALGDSFASGVGTRSYDDTSGACLRSAKAYPAQGFIYLLQFFRQHYFHKLIPVETIGFG